jgi:hypothetical protein
LASFSDIFSFVMKLPFTPAGSTTRREVADLLSDAAMQELIRPGTHLPYAGPIAEFAPMAKVLEPVASPTAGERLRIYRLYVRAYCSRLDLRAQRAAEAAGNPLVYWRWAVPIAWKRIQLEWQGVRYRLGLAVSPGTLQGLVAELGDPLR